MYRDFKYLLSFYKKSSLLYLDDSTILLSLIFYINDFFEKFTSFEKQYNFLRNYFLSRVKWAKLRLFFKKLYLFVLKITILRVTYSIDDFIKILKKRVKKIARYLVSINQFEMRDFLRVVNITRR